jgi:hypothetical protein
VSALESSSGGVTSEGPIVEYHSWVWQNHATNLRMVANLTMRLRFRNIADAGMFTGVMNTHERMARRVYETCMEGAAIWDMLGAYLEMAHAMYMRHDDEAMRQAAKLHEMVTTGAFNPMTGPGPKPFPRVK